MCQHTLTHSLPLSSPISFFLSPSLPLSLFTCISPYPRTSTLTHHTAVDMVTELYLSRREHQKADSSSSSLPAVGSHGDGPGGEREVLHSRHGASADADVSLLTL